jgi:hypothetical protein
MKFRIPLSASIRVQAPSGAYEVRPYLAHFGTGQGAQVLAYVSAVGAKNKQGESELCHLSRSFATLEEAQQAFKDGFEVGEPETAPATRANQILCALRRTEGVVARP